MGKNIDFHVHPTESELWIDSTGPLAPAIARNEKIRNRFIKPIERVAAEYRASNTIGVLLAWDAEAGTGLVRYPNKRVADIVRAYPDVFVGFASVDPWKGKMAISEMKRAVEEHGMKGVKFQQGAQAFYPNDHRFYPLWDACERANVPVLFHTGTTGIGAGLDGGGGIKLDHMRPIPYIDDVAADFPRLKIVCAHVSWPWEDEMLAIARHKRNVYIDLSGELPSRMPQRWKEMLSGPLKTKFLFGTDYPVIGPKAWLDDFRTMGIDDETARLVLSGNAMGILNLDREAGGTR